MTRRIDVPVLEVMVAATLTLVGCSTTSSSVPTPLPATITAMGDLYGCWQGGQYNFVAATIPRMWADADLVARVRIVELERVGMTARIVHMYKGKAEAEVVRLGMGPFCLQPGAEYIAFLKRVQDAKGGPMYSPPGPVGPQAVFRIDGDRIHSGDELSGGIPNYDGMPVKEFERLFGPPQ